MTVLDGMAKRYGCRPSDLIDEAPELARFAIDLEAWEVGREADAIHDEAALKRMMNAVG